MRNQRHSVETIELEKRTLADEGGKIIQKAFAEKRALRLSERRRVQSIHEQISDLDSHLPKHDTRMAGQEDIGGPIERRTDEPKSNGHIALDIVLRGGMPAVAGTELHAQYENRIANFDESERRFISTSAATATIPEDVFSEIFVTLKDYSGIYSLAFVDRTLDGRPKKYAAANDLSVDGEQRNEGDVISGDVAASEVDPDFSGSKTLGAYWIDSGVLKLSNEEKMDAAVDVVGMVTRFGTERIGRKIQTLLANGTGSGQPAGIKNFATIGPTTPVGHPTDFSYSDLVGLLHSVDPLYRKSPSAAWAMNDDSVKKLRLIVDGSQRPLIAPTTSGIDEAQQIRLLGFPVVSDNALPTLAASAKGLYFGDWSRFVVRLAGPMMVQVLNERYADRGLTGYIVHQRIDSGLMDVRSVKYLLQAAS